MGYSNNVQSNDLLLGLLNRLYFIHKADLAVYSNDNDIL